MQNPIAANLYLAQVFFQSAIEITFRSGIDFFRRPWSLMHMHAVIIPVTPFQQNCTLVWCKETMEGAFIDPGGEVNHLLAVADEQAVTVKKILETQPYKTSAKCKQKN